MILDCLDTAAQTRTVMPVDCIIFDAMTDAEQDSEASDGVERSFTCSVCGYPMAYEAAELQAEVRSICHNCGDWTLQTAEPSVVIEAARNVAERLDGPVLTERQALSYLLREVVDLDRAAVADAMDSSPSNVDNLHRRGAEKVDEARRVLDGLDRVRPSEE